MANIKKITLKDASNAQVTYDIFDNGALRRDSSTGKIITGNSVVDSLILDGHYFITQIDDVPVETVITNVLVQDTTTGEIVKRSTDYLLKDIGGTSYSMNDSDGILTLKTGK